MEGTPMKVSDLIAALAKYPLDVDIIVKINESGVLITFEDITRISRWEVTCAGVTSKKIVFSTTKNNKVATVNLAKPDQPE
jgi:hypothetical protein